ncbi:unnamed protein product [Arctogadus glacialis]
MVFTSAHTLHYTTSTPSSTPPPPATTPSSTLPPTDNTLLYTTSTMRSRVISRVKRIQPALTSEERLRKLPYPEAEYLSLRVGARVLVPVGPGFWSLWGPSTSLLPLILDLSLQEHLGGGDQTSCSPLRVEERRPTPLLLGWRRGGGLISSTPNQISPDEDGGPEGLWDDVMQTREECGHRGVPCEHRWSPVLWSTRRHANLTPLLCSTDVCAQLTEGQTIALGLLHLTRGRVCLLLGPCSSEGPAVSRLRNPPTYIMLSPGVLSYVKVFPAVSRCFHCVPRCFQVFTRQIMECFHDLPDVSMTFQMYPDVSRHLQRSKACSRPVRTQADD